MLRETSNLTRSRQPSRGQGHFSAILAGIDEMAVSELARRESRNREKYLPPLSTFRWWARRTGAVNAAVLDAARDVYGDTRLFVVDPFAGGGTIPLVALKSGHQVHAQDLNPWAASGIKQMLSLPAPSALEAGFEKLSELAAPLLQAAYGSYSKTGATETVLHTYRVAVGECGSCSFEHNQFPYALLTLLYRKERRRPEAVLACAAGHVFFGRTDVPETCPVCTLKVDSAEIYVPRRIITCPSCGFQEKLSQRASRPSWRWEVCLLEKGSSTGRRFELPTPEDLVQANSGWVPTIELGEIPLGSETAVLRRHGFGEWVDLYPARQRVVTEQLLMFAQESSDDECVVEALRTAIVGTTEFAGHLSRWDRFYLKCNDATAGHRFNFSTFVPELNVWGSALVGRGTVSRRVRSMIKASEWFEENIGKPVVLGVSAEWTQDSVAEFDAQIACGDSANLLGISDNSVDLVLTDPPYHDDVHYGELSLPFRAWAGLPLDALEGEASSNAVTGVNSDRHSYANSLVRIFSECRRVLKDEGRLIFSYANHEPQAWVALLSALQMAGFFAISCLSLHSENETDFKKRNVQACNEDLMLELGVSDPGRPGTILGAVGEHPFMGQVATLFARTGRLHEGWEDGAVVSLTRAKKGLSTAASQARY